MYEVTIIKSFSAAHVLAEIGGKCEDLHGHNFKVEVTVAASDLDSTGLLIDFRVFKKWLGAILEDIDHKHLNILPSFDGINPSAENIAKYICGKMELRVKPTKVNVVRVKIWESENAAVTYIPKQPSNPS
ncbi:MAG: 6-carboxytetrahydropterin synthase [Smithella sp.]|jgi:6-pyruvoyltetrahydropterin/6-carboxytetrahydropterin synthase